MFFFFLLPHKFYPIHEKVKPILWNKIPPSFTSSANMAHGLGFFFLIKRKGKIGKGYALR